MTVRFDQDAYRRLVLGLWPSDPLPAQPTGAGETLASVDAGIDGLCPCGAQPRDGSAYCSPDCEPTHRGPDTDAPWLGGPHAARWRPDLVSAFDESDLELVEEQRERNLTRRWYRHTDGRRFLRVDDGHRWVGAYAELEDGLQVELWQRLERELGDPRRLGPHGADPMADLREPLQQFAEAMRPAMAAFHASQAAVDAMRSQFAPTWPSASQIDQIMGIPIRIDGSLPPGAWRMEFADGQRIEHHTCQWEPMRVVRNLWWCSVHWSDGKRCDQVTIDPATVRRAKRLVGGPSATGGSS